MITTQGGRRARARLAMRDMNKVLRDPVLVCTILATIVFLAIFICYPLYAILKRSMLDANGAFELSTFLAAVSKSDFLKSLKNTLVLGITVSALSTLIGFVFAYCDAYVKSHFRRLFKVVSLLPTISPPFVLALAAIILFGQFGLVTRQILGIRNNNIYGFPGLVVVQTMTFFPVAYLILVGMLKRIDPSLEEASRNMHASRFQTFMKVTLPLVLPGLANSFLLVFIETIADFANPMVIGGNFDTLATKVFMQAIGNYDQRGGASMAIVLLLLSIGLFAVEKFWIEKKSYVTLTGKASRERPLIEERKIVWSLDAFCLLITIVVLAFYVLVPLGGLFKIIGKDYALTSAHFDYVWKNGLDSIRGSTVLSAWATPFCGMLSMIIAFLLVRKRFIGRTFIEFTSLLAMAVPGTVLGLGYVLAFNTPVLFVPAMTGTAFIIIVAFVVRSLPIGVRSGVTSLGQIDPAIEEAAQDLGASSSKVFTSVTLPLIKDAFFSGLVYAFVRSMTAVSAVVFLITPKYQLLTRMILTQVDNGRFGVACAFSTVLIVIVFIFVALMTFALSRLGVSKTEEAIL